MPATFHCHIHNQSFRTKEARDDLGIAAALIADAMIAASEESNDGH